MKPSVLGRIQKGDQVLILELEVVRFRENLAASHEVPESRKGARKPDPGAHLGEGRLDQPHDNGCPTDRSDLVPEDEGGAPGSDRLAFRAPAVQGLYHVLKA